MPVRMPIESHLEKLRAFYRRERRLPSYAEMLPLLGYSSKNGVARLFRRLNDLGYVRKQPGGKWSPSTRLAGSIQWRGTVAAGFPSPADEELTDLMSLDEFLVERPESTFLLTVSGDSMIDAGIQPGDLVLVERGRTPRNNDIVVAQVDGEWTLKYYVRDRDGIRLDPANRKYPSIRPRSKLTVGGVVRAMVRKYG